ncbi:TonB-dependent receptor [Pigmentiphaga aceris]|uniref:TonB-dependent receptor n=1 Tax=Pigmentiphaga aceris TaxID=1940612 RepID=A0A5C0B6R9_9BURK|nr:TonB-dependent receptor [Pigmentiphaga aceris]
MTAQSLAPVTVTSRRREENDQDVPIPTSVLEGDNLETQRVYRVEDLQQLLPSTSVAYINARQSSIAVRGLGNHPANDGLEGSTGVYLDNVYLGRPGMAVFDLLDIEQIELLRGPQGTLFGKNTTAGLLNIHTRLPTFTPERSVQVSVGQRGLVQTQAIMSGKVAENVAGRLLVYDAHDQGSVTNIANGTRMNGGTRTGLRGQLLVQPDDKFSLRLVADYHIERSSYGTQVLYNLGPGLAFRRATAAGATNIPTDPTRYEVNLDGRQHVSVNQGGLSAEANWRLPSGFRFTSITAGRMWDYTPANDDNINIPVIRNNGFDVQHRQFSQEFRLSSPAGREVDYVLGAYYYHQRMRNQLINDFGPAADAALSGVPSGLLANVSSRSFGALDTDSYALFSQATWHATSRLDFSAGARATYEDKQASVWRASPVGGAPQLAPVRNSPGLLGAYNTGPISLHSWSPSGLLGTSYRFSPDFLGYANLSHGEKSGGVNLAGPGNAATLGPSSLKVGQERVNSLDLGFKSSWWDRKLQFNANLFWAEVSGYQATLLVPQPGVDGAFVQTLTNAGDIRSRGAEFDLRAAPVRGLTLMMNGSFNDARYRRYDNAPCPAETAILRPNATCDLGGRQVAGAPRWIFNVGAEYRQPVGHNAQHYTAVSYAWRSAQDGSLDASVYSRIPSYGVLNVATGWDITQGENLWSVSLWVRNVTDKRYFPAVVATANGAYTASVGTPRTIGATVRYSF